MIATNCIPRLITVSFHGVLVSHESAEKIDFGFLKDNGERLLE